MRQHIPVLCLPLILSSLAAGAPFWRELPSAKCVVSDARPTVDGKLNDAAWKTAAALGPLVTPHGDRPHATTAAMLACDGTNLYVGVRCGEPNMKAVRAERTKRDSDVYTDDCVEIFVDANYDFRTYYHFLVSVANVQRDEIGERRRTPQYDGKWNASWASAVSKGADAWTVEVAIPLEAIGLKGVDRPLIGLNVCRSRAATGELSVWSPTGGGFHEPMRFGTVVFATAPAGPALDAQVQSLSPAKVGVMTAKGTVRNVSGRALSAKCEMRLSSSTTSRRQDLGQGEWKAGESTEHSVPFFVEQTGPHRLSLLMTDLQDGRVLLSKSIAFAVRMMSKKTFGCRLPAAKYDLWWCESTYKVMKNTPVPTRTGDAVEISAAGREYEPFQVVIRSKSGLKRVAASVSDFRCGEHTIPASRFKIHRVAYVPVTIPTDAFGFKADWPDPLPLLRDRFDVPANENVPLWILAHVPADAPAGSYTGHVLLEPSGEPKCRISVALRVYDFALTEETHTRTAYGVGVNSAFLGLKTTDEQDKVHDLYMQSCREHRIAPYRPMARHRIKQTITGPQRRFKSGRLELVLDEYTRQYLDMYWDGKPIGSLSNTMTQFEKKGVGWKGTGVNWPGVDVIQSVQVLERSPRRWVLDVTGEKLGSGPASRRYEITFRLVIPGGAEWFSARMLRLKNIDTVRFEARGYYYILRHSAGDAQKVSKGTYAYWLGNGTYLGAAEATKSASLGLAPIYVQKGARWLAPGEAIEVEQPPVIFFAGQGDKAEAEAAGEEMLKLLRAGAPDTFKPQADLAVVEHTEPSVQLDFTDFDRAARRYLDEWKFNAFNFSAMPGKLGRSGRFKPGYDALHKTVVGRMVEHLREKGWLAKAYSYWYDEPGEEDYPYVIKGMDLLGKNCPGLTRLLTEQPEPALVGHVDLWVPVLSRYKPEDAFERQAHGDQIWWYVCCGPRAPYPNNFIDHPAINHRIRFWMQEKYGVTGSLYWATTYWWGKDRKLRSPWLDGMSINSRGGHWGNGDGILLYPACREPSKTPVLSGPVVSMRWELLREGLEDREYFWTLRQELRKLRPRVAALKGKRQAAARFAILQAERALGAPDRLAASLTDYTKDPQDLFAERKRLAQAIECCRQVGR